MQRETDKNLKFYDLKNNRSQYLPQIYANYNYGYNTSSSNYDLFFESNRWKSFGTFGLKVIVPIFDGFLKRSKINQTKYKIEQVENQLLFLDRSIKRSIKKGDMVAEIFEYPVPDELPPVNPILASPLQL